MFFFFKCYYVLLQCCPFIYVCLCLITAKMEGKKRVEILCYTLNSSGHFLFCDLIFDWLMRTRKKRKEKKREGTSLCSLTIVLASKECYKFQIQNSDIFFLYFLSAIY